MHALSSPDAIAHAIAITLASAHVIATTPELAPLPNPSVHDHYGQLYNHNKSSSAPNTVPLASNDTTWYPTLPLPTIDAIHLHWMNYLPIMTISEMWITMLGFLCVVSVGIVFIILVKYVLKSMSRGRDCGGEEAIEFCLFEVP
eukprot:11084570-Ditylum_brightwellii.AAC.1